MRKSWSDEAWEDYLYWQTQDKKTLRKIHKLLVSIERDGELMGEGHPEKLKGNFVGYCSRNIDDKNRLVYRVDVDNDSIDILECEDHSTTIKSRSTH